MFTYNLSIKFFSGKSAIRPVPVYRWLLVLITAVFAGALIVKGFSFPLFCLAIICAFSALYEESWLFDQSRKILRYRNGLIFLAFTKEIAFEEIDRLEVDIFVRGNAKPQTDDRLRFGQTRMRRYSIVLKDGTVMVIEIKKVMEIDPFFTAFEKLAAAHSLPLEKK